LFSENTFFIFVFCKKQFRVQGIDLPQPKAIFKVTRSQFTDSRYFFGDMPELLGILEAQAIGDFTKRKFRIVDMLFGRFDQLELDRCLSAFPGFLFYQRRGGARGNPICHRR
jgi:hypothetical protein